jgi:hypothetical protein
MPSGAMTDIWACNQCRSINQRRDKRCYNCHTPREIGGVDPLSLSVTERTPVATGPVGVYRSTRGVAVLTSILVFAAVAVSLAVNVLNIEAIETLVNGGRPALTGDGIGTVFLILISVVILAIFSWATWISRVVANLPALDVGYSVYTPRIVFIESLIPIANVRRMHGVMSDVLGRVRPSPRDQIAIIAAWFPLVVTISISFLVFRVTAFVPLPTDVAIQFATVMREISLGLQVVSGLFLVALIWRVEGRLGRRAREIGD